MMVVEDILYIPMMQNQFPKVIGTIDVKNFSERE
jgi:hypothetical protein